MSKRYKLAILIGRFQPAHNGHLAVFKQAANLAEKVQVLVGSSFQPRTIKNPFTFNERKTLIEWMVSPITNSYNIAPIRDYSYNDNLWIQEVQSTVKAANPGIKDDEIIIIGHEKDESSWYLRAFPKWKFVPVDGFVEYGSHPIDATKIRELFFEGHGDFLSGAIPAATLYFMSKFANTPEYELLVEEYKFIKDYKERWSAAPYPPTFFTTDAVVIQGGHILLIKRKNAPGKGLWALPGGFLNQTETALQGMLRELKEETRIKVPVQVLQGSITYTQLFDKPDRSLRGRTLTQAYLIELNTGETELPKVKPRDDAIEAKWFTIAEALEMSEVMFEDHRSIIQTMIGRAK